jgi:hypothetical protein
MAMVDVDLLVSRGLASRALNASAAAQLVDAARRRRDVWILPAFDVHGEHERAAWAQARGLHLKSCNGAAVHCDSAHFPATLCEPVVEFSRCQCCETDTLTALAGTGIC